MSRNSTTIAAGIKLGIFTVVSVLVTGLLAVIMGNVGFGAGSTYQAVFTTASMLQEGDDVRVAGVTVGEVKKVEHHDRSQALVTFRVPSLRHTWRLPLEAQVCTTAEFRPDSKPLVGP